MDENELKSSLNSKLILELIENQVKQYIEDNMTIDIEYEYDNNYGSVNRKITVKVLIDSEVITESTTYIDRL